MDPSVLKVEIKNLQSYTAYNLCVQALTVGYGDCVVKTFLTDEEGKLPEQRSINIKNKGSAVSKLDNVGFSFCVSACF